MRASGVTPRRAASWSVISTTAAAPSLIPEALPAVTVPPSRRKLGRSFCSTSKVVPCLGYSSASTTVSPLRPGTLTATISSLKRPAFWAASAFCCEAAANLSWSIRVICHFCATFSAVLPMW